ncbi:MAG: hypothetical protein LBQ61_01945 [Spirochaetales bacterium]|jgi:predicted outer membrane repeat protein|nr:hypothetical protein [Spirochaetales bacterium]
MKKLIMGIITLTLLAGCNFILGPGGTERGSTGTLTLNFGGSGGGSPSALAINHGGELLPEMLNALLYEVTLTGPGGETLNHALAAGENKTVSLALGEWRVDVWAYYQGGTLIKEGALIGTGSTTVPIKPGANTARINMNMKGPLYEIIIPPMTGGTVASNFSYAFEGTPITLTVTPLNAGAAYKADSLEVNEGTVDLTVSGTTWIFTMPLADVTVTAEFLNGWRYVTANGTGDGSSWANASDDLQKMLDLAAEAKAAGVANALVRVAAGTYKPRYKPNPDGTTNYDTPENDRDSSFILREGVEVRGGYAENGEDIDETTRKGRFGNYGAVAPAYRAILSGDINGDDEDDLRTDNTYHVVLALDIPANSGTILDGFTISGGYANGTSSLLVNTLGVTRNAGGGMYITVTALPSGINIEQPLPPGFPYSTPVLTNVTISGNEALDTGGGMFNGFASPILSHGTISGNKAASGGGGMINAKALPVLTNVTISGNTAGGNGGGMSNESDASAVLTGVDILNNTAANNGGGMSNGDGSMPTLTNVTISGNTATTGNGGGMYSYTASPILTNVTLSGNTAGGYGGGIATRGSVSQPSLPVLTNVIISGNTAAGGGGMYNDDSYSAPVLTNVTIAGNAANNSGGGILNNSSPQIRNSIIWGNTAGNPSEAGIYNDHGNPVITHSIVQDSSYPTVPPPDNDGNMNIGPVFIGWIDPDAVGWTPTTGGDYRLGTGSVAIGAGSDAYYDPGENPDLSAVTTDLDGTARIKGDAIDLGAYEAE